MKIWVHMSNCEDISSSFARPPYLEIFKMSVVCKFNYLHQNNLGLKLKNLKKCGRRARTILHHRTHTYIAVNIPISIELVIFIKLHDIMINTSTQLNANFSGSLCEYTIHSLVLQITAFILIIQTYFLCWCLSLMCVNYMSLFVRTIYLKRTKIYFSLIHIL